MSCNWNIEQLHFFSTVYHLFKTYMKKNSNNLEHDDMRYFAGNFDKFSEAYFEFFQIFAERQ